MFIHLRRQPIGASRSALLNGHSELVEAEDGQDTQSHRERLLGLDSPGHAATGENDRGEQSDLWTVWLALSHAQAAEAILKDVSQHFPFD